MASPEDRLNSFLGEPTATPEKRLDAFLGTPSIKAPSLEDDLKKVTDYPENWFSRQFRETIVEAAKGIAELGHTLLRATDEDDTEARAKVAAIPAAIGEKIKKRSIEIAAEPSAIKRGLGAAGAMAGAVFGEDIDASVSQASLMPILNNPGRTAANLVMNVPGVVAGGAATAAAARGAVTKLPGGATVVRGVDKVLGEVLPKYAWTDEMLAEHASRSGRYFLNTVSETQPLYESAKGLSPAAADWLSPTMTTDRRARANFEKQYRANIGTAWVNTDPKMPLSVDANGFITPTKAPSFAALPADEQARVIKIRTKIDQNHAELYQRGMLNTAEYEAHYLDYIHEMYQIYNNPGEWLNEFGRSMLKPEWARTKPPGQPFAGPMTPQAQLAQARAENWMLKHNVVDPTAEVERVLKQGLRVTKVDEAQVRGGVEGAVGAVIKQKNVPPAIKGLLGPMARDAKFGPINVGTTLDFQNRMLLADDMMNRMMMMQANDGRPLLFRDPKSSVNTGDYVPLAEHPIYTDKWKGALVHPDVEDALATLASTDVTGPLGKLLQLWKGAHVIWNPATHINNLMGNVGFATLAGISPANPRNHKFYRKAVADLAHFYVNPEAALAANPSLANAMRAGAVVPGFAHAEVSSLLNELAAHKATNFLESVLDIMSRTPAQGKVAKAYDLEDQWFRYATFLKHESKGVDARSSSVMINQSYPNYEVTSPVGRFFRGESRYAGMPAGTGAVLGAPFASFPLEAARIYAKAAKEHPMRLLAVSMFPSAMVTAGMATRGQTSDDYYEARKGWSRQDQGKMLLPVPFTEGYMDFSSAFPLGNMLKPLEMADQLFGVKVPVNPFDSTIGQGLVVKPGLETLYNRNFDTGQPVFDPAKGMDARDAVYNWLKQGMPVPSVVWRLSELMKSQMNDTPTRRHQQEVPGLGRGLLEATTPFKLLPDAELEARGRAGMKGEKAELKRGKRSVIKDPTLSESDIERRLENIMKLMEKRSEERN